MLDQGWITDAEARDALRRPIEVQERQQFRGPADHVVAEVKRQLLNDATFAFLGETKEERTKAIFGCPADDVECEGGGGLRIETTIDLEAQQMANDVLAQWFPLLPYEENLAECSRIFPNDDPAFLAVYAESNSCAPTGAIATLDNATGAVEVMASGLPFDIEQFDLVIQGRRNPGSAFKPITAATALEEGISFGSFWDGSSPKEIQCDTPCSDGPDPFIWTVSNAGAGVGTVSLAEATYRSVNTVYAQVAAAVGPENIVDMARRMGITRSQLDPLLSITLGTSAVSPLEMATAFSNFATNGVWASPYIVSRIYDANGDLIYEHETVTHQAADPAIFAAIRENAMVYVPTSAGTAPRANIGRPQGGKTGTHQNYQDAWFVGYVPQYTTAVWTGYEAKQIPLRNVVINGQEYSRVFGGSVPAPIWAEFMTEYLQDVPVEQFPQLPAEQIARYTEVPQVRVPSVVGLDVETAEEAIRDAGFMPWRVPIASLEPPDTVTGQSQIPGTLYEQGQTIFINVSTGDTPVGNVPGIVGATWEQALDAFRQLEFDTGVRVTVVKVDVPGPPDRVNIVQSVDPPPGTQIEFGRTVRVYVGS
jgi:membrane peptidoglycan carboxypeptidase